MINIVATTIFCFSIWIRDALHPAIANMLIFYPLLFAPSECLAVVSNGFCGQHADSIVAEAISEHNPSLKWQLGNRLLISYLHSSVKADANAEWIRACEYYPAITYYTFDALMPWNSQETRIFALRAITNFRTRANLCTIPILTLRRHPQLGLAALTACTTIATKNTTELVIFFVYVDHNRIRLSEYFEFLDFSENLSDNYDIYLFPLIFSRNVFLKEHVLRLYDSRGHTRFFMKCLHFLVDLW